MAAIIDNGTLLPHYFYQRDAACLSVSLPSHHQAGSEKSVSKRESEIVGDRVRVLMISPGRWATSTPCCASRTSVTTLARQTCGAFEFYHGRAAA